MFGYAYLLYGHAHFWSINCITPNSKILCRLYAYISCLRYQPFKIWSIYNHCGDMARPISKVASAAPGMCVFACMPACVHAGRCLSSITIYIYNEAALNSWTSSATFRFLYKALSIAIMNGHGCSNKARHEYLPKKTR